MRVNDAAGGPLENKGGRFMRGKFTFPLASGSHDVGVFSQKLRAKGEFAPVEPGAMCANGDARLLLLCKNIGLCYTSNSESKTCQRE